MTARKLVKMLEDKVMVASRNIDNVQIYDNFSFANLPFEDAEEAIRVFRNKGRDKKPLMVKAKGKQQTDSKTKSSRRRKR